MIKERAWPARAMYILIAAALAMSLMILAAPAQKVSASPDISEWSRVDTPTTDGWVLAPGSDIMDYALADAGETAYAVVYSAFNTSTCSSMEGGEDYLLKSDDYAATWDDITDALEKVDDGSSIQMISRVATDGESADFVAVALVENGELRVYFSTDGGDTFEEEADEVEDDGVYLDLVSDLAVSPEVSGKREIAIGGVDDSGDAALFRCTVEGTSAGDWKDATADEGWDDDGDFTTELVTGITFSTNWATDKTVLVTTVDVLDNSWYSDVEFATLYLQCGSWGTTAGWNEFSTLGIDAVPILEDEDLPMWLADWDAREIAGMTLPEDYNSKNSNTRILWLWVNYYDEDTDEPMCQITRVDDDSADPVGPMGQVEDGELWLRSISYKGTIAEGEAIAGVLGDGMEDYALCCQGVQVYRNDGIKNMDICCERWHDACKPPTGIWAMAVSYVGEDKAYAVALVADEDYDEGAWSVTFDDGDTWNQLSLIDTNIDYFSDVAVSPDCNKTMLVSVNVEKVCIEYGEGEGRACDSVWLHADTLPEAEEYSGQWLRTWCDELEGTGWGSTGEEAGMLRLAPEETTGDTVVLFDYYTGNVYMNNLETLACWDPIGSTVLKNIVDLALQDADSLFALDTNGDVAMFDDDEWQEEVDSEVEAGWTIAVWGDNVLVGGCNGDWNYSDDGAQTWALEWTPEDLDSDFFVTVAFDTYFDENNTIYAAGASAAWEDETTTTGAIASWVIGESDSWQYLNAQPLESQIGIYDGDGVDEDVDVAFTGLVVDRPGNPFTDAANGGVIYASYYGYYEGHWFTGVARSLERMVEVCTTCLDWDYLHVGLTTDVEGFEAMPDALKICGCLTPDTNSNLFAIDEWHYYDFCDNEAGSVWTYEDCYSKKAPEITYPADGDVIEADPCSCYSIPFTVLWDTLCDACSYDIAFALDEAFDMPVRVNGEEVDYTYHLEEQDVPAYSIMGGAEGGLSCETTYYIRVRAADAATGEIIHSWWSDPIAITIAPSVQSGVINLVAPAPGATGIGTKNVGFSWDLLADADTFDWMLSPNADLSSPLASETGLTNKAATYTGTLEHDTTYYWQVKAYSGGALLSTSAIGTFTTGATGPFCSAIDGLCFDTQAELQAHNDSLAEEPAATPFWVWVVIAIGAVLVIVVIVLIFRTRRV